MSKPTKPNSSTGSNTELNTGLSSNTELNSKNVKMEERLPQTGQFIDTKMLIAIGLMLIIAGNVINRKKHNK